MSAKNRQPQTRSNRFTRREFLEAVSVLAAAPAVLVVKQRGTRGKPPTLAYVGTYSSGGNANGGRGIHIFEIDPTSGALTPRDVFETKVNPAWLAFDPSHTHLYSANEVSNLPGNSGSVSAYAIERPSGRLTLLNTVSSEGGGPAHMSVHPSGTFAFAANYGGGSIVVLPIRANGELGAATDVKRHQGTVGPTRAASAPAGSFAISGHDRPHAHMIQSDPAGRFVFAADLGLDQILIWKFDAQAGTLAPADPPFVSVPPGDGPRHFVFHPNGRWFYSLQEEGSTVMVFDYDAALGRLTAKQTVASVPKGFAGTNFTSEILVSPDARFLYAANRLHDSIAWFSIGPQGTLTFVGEEWTRGDYPRSFNIDPTGTFLYSCNQRSDAVVVFRLHRGTGRPTFTGLYTPVGAPAAIVFG
jgi:6-phosphogluconolactonase (cycloisomerase 2 family)